MIIDFKLPPEKPIGKATIPHHNHHDHQQQPAFIPCFRWPTRGTLLVSVTLAGCLLLATILLLLSVATSALHTLHTSLLQVPNITTFLHPDNNFLLLVDDGLNGRMVEFDGRSVGLDGQNIALDGRTVGRDGRTVGLDGLTVGPDGPDSQSVGRPRWTTERLARRLPQCIIIGARKSGTRALIEFLNLHPRIRKASDEIHFFDEEQNFQRGLDWYRRKMPFSYADQITIEKSPAYFITRYVPERIRAMNATIRLVIVVKDPVTRVISDYAQTLANRIKKGKHYLSFEDTVLTPDGAVDVSYKPIRVSLYHRHLEYWLRVFPRDQLLIVDGDRLVTDPVLELERVETFLGLEHRINASHFHFNATKGFFCIRDAQNDRVDRCLSKTKGRAHPDVPSDVMAKLRDFFRPHNERFFREIGRRFDW
ncbi:Heparan sulfate glucosamine 3-O-sulfotransferase 5 [Hypsibius exemplaris]|uniref:Heparan sulfate glucosamine 3-O-sulfotransferase 5 n=1 Tax=Hypsibius exemplaris TaxID=2072580 RepID=A0A9X6NCF4_HYPEX|nr:Heparan sulfate glucosamine 3-O-sulfotransferase 5 [Hypsibius exemplaris]